MNRRSIRRPDLDELNRETRRAIWRARAEACAWLALCAAALAYLAHRHFPEAFRLVFGF